MSILDSIKALFCKKCVFTSDQEPTHIETTTASPAATTSAEKLQIPEDSALKRHFLSALKADIEAGMPPRPTDSTLQRHYDSTVQSQLENLLN